MTAAPPDSNVVRSEEGLDILRAEKDPITGALLNNANFWFMKKFFAQKDRPVTDHDYKFFMELMRDIFSEHEVLRKILEGELVGKFFEDTSEVLGGEQTLMSRISDSTPREIIFKGHLDVSTVPAFFEAWRSAYWPEQRELVLNCRHLTSEAPTAIVVFWLVSKEAREVGTKLRFLGIDDYLSHPQVPNCLRADLCEWSVEPVRKNFFARMYSRLRHRNVEFFFKR